MTPESVGPLSRPVSVEHLPEGGVEVVVEAAPEERAALARDFKLPAIHALEGRFKLTGSARRVHVAGVVRARLEQVCVVTLDPFEDTIEEEVEVDFAGSRAGVSPAAGEGPGYEPPDEITGGQIDLGALTAEFLALGLDPYPRKPGAEFSHDGRDQAPPSPFEALKDLKPGS
ncbi:MAG TPA: DUF177 domain-containing protein [Beijerinckiaceae bacterium]|jgi:uncharacterized metal-binding protein YceD (DUF177 family)